MARVDSTIVELEEKHVVHSMQLHAGIFSIWGPSKALGAYLLAHSLRDDSLRLVSPVTVLFHILPSMSKP